MNIELKNNFLYFKNYKLRCAVGKRGITLRKKEGDKKTPKGIFSIRSIFYRKDRISKITTVIRKKIIKKDMGWCDDSNSKFYNQLIKLPFKDSAEKLWLIEKIYDVVVVINYNLNPITKNKGSAVFLHLAKKNYLPTNGCVAINKKDMLFLIAKINKKTKLVIH
jgi:L,D-peptidoglycan transpeptidase YkuD (ErfK/YbiS/YcfS/YnhG family)|tara:strand:+ start:1740 stop:2231 length:492 start_codon:yes stop_codon:yes gene_type:complete